MILVWTRSNKIKAILRSGQVEFKTLEEVEHILQCQYDHLKNNEFITKFHQERIKSRIDHLKLFLRKELTRVALCV